MIYRNLRMDFSLFHRSNHLLWQHFKNYGMKFLYMKN